MTPRERFLSACRGEATDRPPVWLMRQAGRYLPEYHEVRRHHGFLEICRSPDLAAEVSLQPIRRFPVDVAIVFSDILVVPEAMGQRLSFDGGPPMLVPKVGPGPDELPPERLEPPTAAALSYVGKAIQQLAERLKRAGDDRAVMGFAGAPLTLAAYMTAGGPPGDLGALKSLLRGSAEKAHLLLDRLTDALVGYLRMQVASGADTLQVFESCGDQVEPETYRTFGIPALRRLFERLKPEPVPVVLYVNGTAAHLESLRSVPFDVLGVDCRTDLASVRRTLGPDVALQGNVDPDLLKAPNDAIRDEVVALCERVGKRGLVFNLGGGVRPDTPVRGVDAFVQAVLSLKDGQ